MRAFLLLLAAVLGAQVPAPKPKPSAAKPAPAKSTAAKPVAKKTATAKPKPAAPALTTDDEKTVYSLGLTMYRSLAPFDLSPAELELVKRGLNDAIAGKPAVELNEWRPKIDQLGRSRSGRASEREKAASLTYLEKTAAEPGAVKTESGLIYREVTAGSGASPKATDIAKVHYRGTLINGTEFDSSYKRNEPSQFPLNRVIRCWTEGVQKMKVGGKSVLVCPSDIAYGDNGRPPIIPPGATLVFEIELLEVAGSATPPQP